MSSWRHDGRIAYDSAILTAAIGVSARRRLGVPIFDGRVGVPKLLAEVLHPAARRAPGCSCLPRR